MQVIGGGRAVQFPNESEIDELRCFIEDRSSDRNDNGELKYKFKIEKTQENVRLPDGKLERYLIIIKPKDPQFSNISFEYDGVHMDMILVMHDRLSLKDLIEKSDSYRFMPNQSIASDMLYDIELEIDNYLFEEFSQKKPALLTNQPTKMT